jgi:hypothetical protein
VMREPVGVRPVILDTARCTASGRGSETRRGVGALDRGGLSWPSTVGPRTLSQPRREGTPPLKPGVASGDGDA